MRSNSEGQIGFLGESNRICVALSRARKGLYCIGNFNQLKSQSKLWKEICDDLKAKDGIADSLQLVCKKHNNVTRVRKAREFNPSGGCNMPCGDRLPCGHACDKRCHTSSHRKGECLKMCLNRCPNDHPFLYRCHYPKACPMCFHKMLRTVPTCGHEQQIPCSVDPEKFSCRAKCEIILPCKHKCANECGQQCTTLCQGIYIKTLPCGHKKGLQCHKDPIVYNHCEINCTKLLNCGHPCSRKCREKCQCNSTIEVQLPCEHVKQVLCHKKDYPGPCFQKCKRNLQCGHDCPGICHEDCAMKRCKTDVVKYLPCGHQQSVPCYQNPQTAFCFAPCPRKLACGHKCSSVCGRLCHEVKCEELCQKNCERDHSCQKRCHSGSPCGDCMIEIDSKFSTCGHSIKNPCFVDPATLTCKQPCERMRICGHPCTEICSRNCEARACKVLVPRTLSCNHVVTLECHKNPENQKCKETVEVSLPCGHNASLECHVTKAGLESVACKEKVEKELSCHHKLSLPCYKDPGECTCRKKVDVKLPCGHMKSIPCSTVTAGLPGVCCTVKVTRTLPCNHETILPCYLKPEEYCCLKKVEITLLCGHNKFITCSSVRDEFLGGVCSIKVTRRLPCAHEKQMQCSNKPDKAFCDAPCERILPCGHQCPNKCGDDCTSFKCAVRVKKNLTCGYHLVTCFCSEDVSQLICSNECKQNLTCGHQCPGRCCDDCSQFKCQKMVVKKLSCSGNHSVKMPCSRDPNRVVCQGVCNRKLECGHPCPGLCSEPCDSTKCRRRVEKQYACGHKEEIQCFQSKTRSCEAPCRRRERCKHVCKGVCGKPCSDYPCEVVVGKSLPCGHKIKVPCSYSVDVEQCSAVCGAKLPCGHQCVATCSDCQPSGSHEMCRLPCSRLLICLHRCKATCSEPCPPCDRQCSRRCPHTECTKRCSQPCEPCKKPCTWSCPHYQSSNLCGEECDRPQCDAPCPKKLACRHPCTGLCGEICPTRCAICHAKKLSSILGGGRGKRTEGTKFLQLFDCGHILTVEEMDTWMMHQLRNDVQLIQCPRCCKAITFSFRYGNLIKRTVKNTESVKKEIYKLANEATHFCEDLMADVSLLRGNLRMMKFPKDVLALLQRQAKVQRLPRHPHSEVVDRIRVRNIPFLFTIKNHLLTMHLVKKVQLRLQNGTKDEVCSKEHLKIKQQTSTVNQDLKKILQYLMKPQLDLRTLDQVHVHTRKFSLFACVLEAQYESIKQHKLLSSIGETRLKMAHEGFNLFLQGQNDALQLDWLERIVILLRKEVGLASLPPEESKEFENFPGVSKGVWKLCEHHEVYFTRSIVRDGEAVNVVSKSCRRCFDKGKRD